MRHQQRQLLEDQSQLQKDIEVWEKKLVHSKQHQRAAAANYDAAAEAASSLMVTATIGLGTMGAAARPGGGSEANDENVGAAAATSLQLTTELDKKLRVMSDKLDMRILSAEIRATLPALQQRAELLEREASGASKTSYKNLRQQQKHFPSVLLRPVSEIEAQLGQVLEEQLRIKNQGRRDVEAKRSEKSVLLGEIAVQRRRLAALREEFSVAEAQRVKGLYALREEEQRLQLLRQELRSFRDGIILDGSQSGGHSSRSNSDDGDTSAAASGRAAASATGIDSIRGVMDWHKLAYLEIIDPTGVLRSQAEGSSTTLEATFAAAVKPSVAQVSAVLLQQQWICPEPSASRGSDWEQQQAAFEEILSAAGLQQRRRRARSGSSSSGGGDGVDFEEFVDLCQQLVRDCEIVSRSG